LAGNIEDIRRAEKVDEGIGVKNLRGVRTSLNTLQSFTHIKWKITIGFYFSS
jgi:hypothetical protein